MFERQFTAPTLRRIIAENASGDIRLKNFGNDLNRYAAYLCRQDEQHRLIYYRPRKDKEGRAVLANAGDRRGGSWVTSPLHKPPKLLRIVQDEIHELLCTDSKKYQPIRELTRGKGHYGQTFLVGSIASVIAASVGMSIALAMSLVAVCLLSACSVGRHSFCQYYEKKQRLPRPPRMKVAKKRTSKTKRVSKKKQ